MDAPRIALLQFEVDNPPGYVARFLAAAGCPGTRVRLDLDPHAALDPYDGLVLLGGPMMVGDDEPWMTRVLDRVRAALADGTPVLGHCLGAQLLAHAAGGSVGPCPHPEIGWVDVRPADTGAARCVLGPLAAEPAHPVLHWHLQSFTLPPGADWLLTRAEMPQQAFVLGPHIGVQAHIEIEADTLADWLDTSPDPRDAYGGDDDIDPAHASITSRAEIAAATPHRLPASQRLAARIYGVWLQSVQMRHRAATRS